MRIMNDCPLINDESVTVGWLRIGKRLETSEHSCQLILDLKSRSNAIQFAGGFVRVCCSVSSRGGVQGNVSLNLASWRSAAALIDDAVAVAVFTIWHAVFKVDALTPSL